MAVLAVASSAGAAPQTPEPISPQPPVADLVAPSGASAPGLAKWARFAGRPPDFAVPAGGTIGRTTYVDGSEGVTLRRDDGSMFATGVLNADGNYEIIKYFDADGGLVQTVAATYADQGRRRVRGEQARCGANGQGTSGWKVTAQPFGWFITTGSIPSYLNRSRAIAAVRAGHGNWNSNGNTCGIPDQSAMAWQYRGGANYSVGRNGRSSVGFGNTRALGGACAGLTVIACTLTWGANGRITESDTRFGTDVKFYAAPGFRPDGFDIEGVMTHEAGHSMGFEHVGDSDNVMSPSTSPGNNSNRSLGRGDANLNNAVY
ncbi:MAG: matrixin family metalloprotease [Actinobacteria bacterium]|nr:matrixin family metalloprotease [Actinomycetota bacterium]